MTQEFRLTPFEADQPAKRNRVIPIGPPLCVRCKSLIDVWAQFICDECRLLPFFQFWWGVQL